MEEKQVTFEDELERLINKYSKENGSDTPDFILAKYLNGCLEVYNIALQSRERWYDRELSKNLKNLIGLKGGN